MCFVSSARSGAFLRHLSHFIYVELVKHRSTVVFPSSHIGIFPGRSVRSQSLKVRFLRDIFDLTSCDVRLWTFREESTNSGRYS